jgi:L-Ala-D/L-Glu epimerase
MRIVELETTPYALPFREPYVSARGMLERREMVLLTVLTDTGHVGFGEAVPLALRRGDSIVAVERGIRKLERRLRRTELDALTGADPFEGAVDAFVEVAAGRRLPPPASAAVEMALLDLAGRVSGKPLWDLLRADDAAPVTCNATLAAGEPDAVAAEASRWAADGFSTFKLKLGTGADLDQVSAVREAVGPEARIRIDANGSWSVEDAIAILRRLDPLGIELAEQPAAGLRELAAVRAEASIPIAADESVASSKEAARAVKAGACDLATVKLAKVGGIGPTGGIARELPIYLSSALDGPVGIAAAAHAAQALGRIRPDPGLAHGLATQRLFATTIATRECELRGDQLHLPGGPGLGIEIDTEALVEHRL